MRILALDSSGLVASVAVLEEEQIIAEYTVNYKKTHSQTLLPMLDEVAKMTELDLNTMDAIAVAGGPGSFTGLRIGSATAKGLGLALNKPLIHVPTLEGLAYNLYGNEGLICPIMDARRNQVYTGIYTFQVGTLRVIERQMAISVDELIKRLNGWNGAVTFLGDGVPVYKEQLEKGLTVPYSFALPHMNRQRAASVGALGIRYYKEGRIETAMEHEPDYLRVSQAERERAEREAREKEPKVRLMTAQDTDAVAAIETELFPDAWSRQGISDTLNNPQTVCFVEEKQGLLTGYLMVYLAADEAEIAKIAVSPEYQRQGGGGRLLLALENECETRKINKLLLDVRESNETARLFYQNSGFVEDGIRQGFYQSPEEDAVLMSRQLGC
ncbi:MAG: tRNA (adenosine(37)-N6)-threonylcarbamoyltransferase complex dimerization subunit type 1 TsaB [Hespellia sp.]|nr:tRNA (adenosine(37)-N6)-threonylcarbamoyltransferase complex dimerization subunit type 1 TsaB [Hespellia sp.]